MTQIIKLVEEIARAIFIPLLFVVILTIVAGTVYIAGQAYGNQFWINFSSDGIATFLSIVIGIPVGWYLAKFQELQTEKERSERILELLCGELSWNLEQLNYWNPGNSDERIILSSTLSERLRVDMWVAFSDGGELEWIRDPNLLSTLAVAFSSIMAIRNLADKFYRAHQFKNRWSSHKVNKHLRTSLEQRISRAEKDIREALSLIDNDLG